VPDPTGRSQPTTRDGSTLKTLSDVGDGEHRMGKPDRKLENRLGGTPGQEAIGQPRAAKPARQKQPNRTAEER
jgi:hypothetical protein